jgi:hypothetical protein
MDGIPNACSFLHALPAEFALRMGHGRIITLTFSFEGRASLRLAGQHEPAEACHEPFRYSIC